MSHLTFDTRLGSGHSRARHKVRIRTVQRIGLRHCYCCSQMALQSHASPLRLSVPLSSPGLIAIDESSSPRLTDLEEIKPQISNAPTIAGSINSCTPQLESVVIIEVNQQSLLNNITYY